MCFLLYVCGCTVWMHVCRVLSICIIKCTVWMHVCRVLSICIIKVLLQATHTGSALPLYTRAVITIDIDGDNSPPPPPNYEFTD